MKKIEAKICPVCGQLTIRRFVKGACELCYNKEFARNYYLKHRRKILEQHHNWREKNPNYNRDYHETHREEILARKYRYRQEHQIEIQAYRYKYERTNPEKKALRQARRRARLQNLPDTLTEDDLLRVLARSCFYCGEELNPTLDHFVPLGADDNKACGTTLANSVAACQKCNSWKSIKMPEQILEQLSLV